MPQWKDIDIFMRKKANGDIADMEDNDAITNSLYNIFTTMVGDRRFLNEFASVLYNTLFEQITVENAQEIEERIRNILVRWEDRIVIRQVDVTPLPDKKTYMIKVEYHIKSDPNRKYLKLYTITIKAWIKWVI